MGIKTEVEIFPATSDNRFIRKNEISAIGFSPIKNTPILLHDSNEAISTVNFMKGIYIYCYLIKLNY